MFGIQTVPKIGVIPFDFTKLCELVEMPSILGGGTREGLVIKPVKERFDERLGRVLLKLISNKFLAS